MTPLRNSRPTASIILCSILFFVSVLLLGCPHVIYAVPTLMNEAPRFPGPLPAAPGSKFVPITLRLGTEGHFVLFHLRVDGTNLEPSAGTCRRWFLRRGARETQDAPRSFCDQDDARFYVATGVPHTLELIVGSEHTVATRVLLEPGENLHWKMPITTRLIELSINLQPGSSYTLRGGEEVLHLQNALPKDAPRGTSWDVDQHEPIFYRGLEVGSMQIEVLRNADRRVESALSVPLYSGRMKCEAPFCEGE